MKAKIYLLAITLIFISCNGKRPQETNTVSKQDSIIENKKGTINHVSDSVVVELLDTLQERVQRDITTATIANNLFSDTKKLYINNKINGEIANEMIDCIYTAYQENWIDEINTINLVLIKVKELNPKLNVPKLNDDKLNKGYE
jgi:hypothetical protein